MQNNIVKSIVQCCVLPWLPNELSIYKVGMQRTDESILKAFKVNVSTVQRWRLFLQEKYSEYRNVQSEYDSFNVLSDLS